MERKFIILLLGVISFAVVFAVQQKALLNQYVFHDDCNQYTFSYYKLGDPQLFPDDLLTSYALRYNTKAVVLFYALLGKIIDPLALSKILPFVLCFLAALYAFLIGEETDRPDVGFLAAVLFIMHSWTFSCFSGGHAKAFAFPLLLSFLFYVIKKNYFVLSILLVLQIFTYPPVAAVSMVTIVLLFLLPLIYSEKPARDVKDIKFFSLLLAAGMLILCGMYLRPDDFMGSVFSFREMLQMPEFYAGGRDPHFIASFSALRNGGAAENVIGFPPYAPPTWILLFMSLAGFVLILRKKIKVHRALTAVGLSGVMLFFTAWAVFFHLFSPGRYLKVALFLYMIFLSAQALYYIFRRIWPQRRMIFVLIAAVILIYIPFLDGNVQYYGDKGLYNFLSSLPHDALIAGHPEEMDEIPLICKRKVLIQRELSLPYYKNYYGEVVRRTNDFFGLYYAGEMNAAREISREYGIDYLVITKEHFSKNYVKHGFFYQGPFNDSVKEVVKANIGNRFVFQNIPMEKRLYEDERFIVIAAEKGEGLL